MIRENLLKIIKQTVLDSYGTPPLEDCQRLQNEYDNILNLLSNCTLDQLWSIYQGYILPNHSFKILPSTPVSDHLAVQFSGMYVAILPDGSRHT